jgi:hypothetical protein
MHRIAEDPVDHCVAEGIGKGGFGTVADFLEAP